VYGFLFLRKSFHWLRRCAAAGSALAIVGAMRRSGEEAQRENEMYLDP